MFGLGNVGRGTFVDSLYQNRSWGWFWRSWGLLCTPSMACRQQAHSGGWVPASSSSFLSWLCLCTVGSHRQAAAVVKRTVYVWKRSSDKRHRGLSGTLKSRVSRVLNASYLGCREMRHGTKGYPVKGAFSSNQPLWTSEVSPPGDLWEVRELEYLLLPPSTPTMPSRWLKDVPGVLISWHDCPVAGDTGAST